LKLRLLAEFQRQLKAGGFRAPIGRDPKTRKKVRSPRSWLQLFALTDGTVSESALSIQPVTSGAVGGRRVEKERSNRPSRPMRYL
jgi:hypothetical protein